MPGNFAVIFYIFMAIFIVMFLFIASVTIISLRRGIKAERRNDKSPRLTVRAKVAAKREHVWYNRRTSSRMSGRSEYFVTFEVDSGDRMELSVDGAEYGMLVEGDSGSLTFQGTRFLNFERDMQK